MASLTPLSKGLIALAVLGGMASAVWHLVLKDRLAAPAMSASQAPTSQTSPSAAIDTPAAATVPVTPSTPVAPATPAAATPPEAPPVTAAQSRQLSSADNAELGRKRLAGGDFAQARMHLEQAVKDGDGASACLLGEMTFKGQGGIRADQDQAARLFQLAQSRNTICFASGK